MLKRETFVVVFFSIPVSFQSWMNFKNAPRQHVSAPNAKFLLHFTNHRSVFLISKTRTKSDGCFLSLVSSRYVGLITFNQSFSFGDVMYLNIDNTLLYVVNYECCSPGIPSHAVCQCRRATILDVSAESTLHNSTQRNSIGVIFKHISCSISLSLKTLLLFFCYRVCYSTDDSEHSICCPMIINIFDLISCA